MTSRNLDSGFWNTPPLRKIVREEMRPVNEKFPNALIRWEILECGHELHQREDFYGPTNAARRRCWECLKEHNAELRADRPSNVRRLSEVR